MLEEEERRLEEEQRREEAIRRRNEAELAEIEQMEQLAAEQEALLREEEERIERERIEAEEELARLEAEEATELRREAEARRAAEGTARRRQRVVGLTFSHSSPSGSQTQSRRCSPKRGRGPSSRRYCFCCVATARALTLASRDAEAKKKAEEDEWSAISSLAATDASLGARQSDTDDAWAKEMSELDALSGADMFDMRLSTLEKFAGGNSTPHVAKSATVDPTDPYGQLPGNPNKANESKQPKRALPKPASKRPTAVDAAAEERRRAALEELKRLEEEERLLEEEERLLMEGGELDEEAELELEIQRQLELEQEENERRRKQQQTKQQQQQQLQNHSQQNQQQLFAAERQQELEAQRARAVASPNAAPYGQLPSDSHAKAPPPDAHAAIDDDIDNQFDFLDGIDDLMDDAMAALNLDAPPAATSAVVDDAATSTAATDNDAVVPEFDTPDEGVADDDDEAIDEVCDGLATNNSRPHPRRTTLLTAMLCCARPTWTTSALAAAPRRRCLPTLIWPHFCSPPPPPPPLPLNRLTNSFQQRLDRPPRQPAIPRINNCQPASNSGPKRLTTTRETTWPNCLAGSSWSAKPIRRESAARPRTSRRAMGAMTTMTTTLTLIRRNWYVHADPPPQSFLFFCALTYFSLRRSEQRQYPVRAANALQCPKPDRKKRKSRNR